MQPLKPRLTRCILRVDEAVPWHLRRLTRSQIWAPKREKHVWIMSKRCRKGTSKEKCCHQTLKIIPARDPKGTWRRDTRLDSTSSLREDLCGRSCARSLADFCRIVGASVRDPFVRLFVQSACKGYPEKISVRDFKVQSLFKLALRDLWASCLSKDLCSLHQVYAQEVSWQDLCTRSL